MSNLLPRSRLSVLATGSALALVIGLALPAAVGAATSHISTDPYTQATCKASATTNHHTEVEPDTFSNGSTIVATFQVGRVFDGGSCDIGFATSTNNGGAWTNGLLRGTTVFEGGPYHRISDPAVAFDASHNTWLIASLALKGTSGAAVLVSQSTNGGTTWANPVVVHAASGSENLDKEWIVCDDTSTSTFYGHCYVEWDNNGAGNLLQMSTSTDGGQTWSAPT